MVRAVRTTSYGLLKLLLLWSLLNINYAHGAPVRDETGESHSQDYLFGVFPFLAASRLEAIFAHVAREMGERVGHRVVYTSAADFNVFMKKLGRQTYDIAFIQPFDFVRIAESSGYLPLVKRNGYLAAEILVREGSELKDIAGLAGKRLGLPPQVAAVSYLTLNTLYGEGLRPGIDMNISYYRNHDSCIHHLIIGEIDACATAAAPAKHMENIMQAHFKVIGRSSYISHSLIVAHERVPVQVRDKLRDYLLSITLLPTKNKILKEGNAFIPVMDGDYADVREYWRKFNFENARYFRQARILH